MSAELDFLEKNVFALSSYRFLEVCGWVCFRDYNI